MRCNTLGSSSRLDSRYRPLSERLVAQVNQDKSPQSSGRTLVSAHRNSALDISLRDFLKRGMHLCRYRDSGLAGGNSALQVGLVTTAKKHDL